MKKIVISKESVRWQILGDVWNYCFLPPGGITGASAELPSGPHTCVSGKAVDGEAEDNGGGACACGGGLPSPEEAKRGAESSQSRQHGQAIEPEVKYAGEQHPRAAAPSLPSPNSGADVGNVPKTIVQTQAIWIVCLIAHEVSCLPQQAVTRPSRLWTRLSITEGWPEIKWEDIQLRGAVRVAGNISVPWSFSQNFLILAVYWQLSVVLDKYCPLDGKKITLSMHHALSMPGTSIEPSETMTKTSAVHKVVS